MSSGSAAARSGAVTHAVRRTGLLRERRSARVRGAGRRRRCRPDAGCVPRRRQGAEGGAFRLCGPGDHRLLQLLVAPDEVNARIPNNTRIAQAVVEQCETRRDRFGILSIRPGQQEVSDCSATRQQLRGCYYPGSACPSARGRRQSLSHPPDTSPASARAPIVSAACTRRPRMKRSAASRPAADGSHPRAARVPDRRQRAGPPEFPRRERDPRLPIRRPRRPGVGRPHDVERSGMEIRGPSTAPAVRRVVHPAGHGLGDVRAKCRKPVDAGAAGRGGLPADDLANRRAARADAQRGVLRAVRPGHDDTGRHRPRTPDVPVGVAPVRPSEFTIVRIRQKTAGSRARPPGI